MANNMNRLITLLKSPRVPWRLRNAITLSRNKIYFYRQRWLQRGLSSVPAKPVLVFECGFHGMTGGPVAIASIASTLAEDFEVYFVSFPESHYNPLLSRSVRLLRHRKELRRQIAAFVSDENLPTTALKALRAEGPLLLTVHCLKDELTGLSPHQLEAALDCADQVHFVSQMQQDSFRLRNAPTIIPNSCRQVEKTQHGQAVGSVGRLEAPDKNAVQAVAIARVAGISPIHLWGAELTTFSGDDVVVHGWSNNKTSIFNSIDVLVSMSKFETFGLVVIEAMSAGIPCLLSDIAAFRQFRDCPGIALVDPEDTRAAAIVLQQLMAEKESLKPLLQAHWRDHYSPSAVRTRWHELLRHTIGTRGQPRIR